MDNRHRCHTQHRPEGPPTSQTVVRVHTHVINHKAQRPHRNKGVGQIAVTKVQRPLISVEEERQCHHQPHKDQSRYHTINRQHLRIIQESKWSLVPKLIKQ